MKIAIIGGGWVGCHLANKLKDSHTISLFEKNKNLFEETSYKNQNRLHLGFHYPRNYSTRELCKNTFKLFINDYGFLVEEVKNNLYCIPKTNSIIDFKTYKQILNVTNDYHVDEVINIEGCVKTIEKKINFKGAKSFFNENLKNLIINKKINKNDLKKLSKKYDLVIDTTNNQLMELNSNCFLEPTVTLLYRKLKKTSFGAITLMDGPFFSIYPYIDDLYTITDVEHTPLKKVNNVKRLKYFYNNLSIDLINKKKDLIQKKIYKYYPNFLNDFVYVDYMLSTKCKINSASDDRYPIIISNGNIISCFTGKIQGIYVIEDYIKDIIKNNNYDK
jgi:hypothetical protein